jgi:hypothetical protein
MGYDLYTVTEGREHLIGIGAMTMLRGQMIRCGMLVEDDAAMAVAPAGIPDWALSGHGGRMVTPGQITAALATYDALPEDVRPAGARWEEWVVYLRTAQEHGGFRVC